LVPVYISKFPNIGDHSHMRILFLCSRILPQIRNGTDLRVQSQIATLAKLAPTAVFSNQYSNAKPVPGVELWKSGDTDLDISNFRNTKFISKLFTEKTGPFHLHYSESTAIKLKRVLEEFKPDQIIISKLYQTVYMEILENYKDARLILDLDESSLQILKSIGPIISDRATRILNTKYYEMVCSYELNMLPRFSKIWVSSEIEVVRIKNQYGSDTPVVNIPNCVDLSKYSDFSEPKLMKQIIYPASFAHPPNEDAAKLITEQIIPIMKDFKFQFVGSSIPNWLLDLSKDNIEVISDVPSMAPYIQKAGIMLIPLRAGAGTRLKALEAFASKTPVVSTRIGVEGLNVVDGEHVMIAETPKEFADACTMLIQNPDLYRRLVESAHQYTRNNFSYEALLKLIKGDLQV
jgi:glycosyltransferase involved in cell wall biosynthesis